VLYELHVGTFTPEGTFDGVAARIDHLVGLGIDAIELLPVATFAGDRGWGYDGVGLYAPHPAYGGPAGLKRLVDACHQAGIGVILDVVYNHLGPAGNYLSEFGPYFSRHHRTNWGAGINLDGPGSDEVRRFLIDNALMWLADYHFDGLRLDAVHALADDSALTFLEQLSIEVEAMQAHLGRPLTLIAESDRNDPRFVRPREQGGYGLAASWADEWHHAWHAVLTGETDGYYSDFGSLDQLAKALRQAWVYDGVYSHHRGRSHGRPPRGLTGDQFVVSTQNHDQVGNRAAGQRSAALMSPDRLKVSAALLLTSPFVPMLFQGEEWGASTRWQYFTDFGEPALARAVTEGRRAEFSYFGWDPDEVPDPQDPATFARSVLDWTEVDDAGPADLLAWYRGLLALRRSTPDLTDTRLDRTGVWVDAEAGGLLVRRGRVVVAANLGRSALRLVGAPARTLLASPGIRRDGSGDVFTPPDSIVITRDAGEKRGGRRTATPPPTSLAPCSWAPDLD
jgi:maltooligosyltrehalose trehalohydrolase